VFVVFGKVVTLVLAKGDAGDVVTSVCKPLGKLHIGHTVAHLLVDRLNQRAAANVAARQDWR
jgi:hypothetical protein